MSQPSCRQVFDTLPILAGAHAGLLLASHYRGKRENSDPEAKAQILDAARRAVQRTQPLYQLAFDRWERGTPVAPERRILHFQTTGRVLCGLGNKGVLESGIRLHHTYGVPFLPGSSLKGICAHYCAEVWGEDHRFAEKGDVFGTLFGTTKQAGFLQFHDGWLLPEECSSNRGGLLRDVITPHHTEYYRTTKVAPQPFDDPNPISLLSVAGKFRIALEIDADPSDTSTQEALTLGAALLEQALVNWGIGAKTSSGYGRMKLVNHKE